LNTSEQIDQYRQQAANEIRIMHQVVDNVNADPMLSELAKTQKKQAAYDIARVNKTALYEKEKGFVDTTIAALTKTVWGYLTSDQIIERRDADSRVAAIQDRDEAKAAYTRAEALSDSTMLKALAFRAQDHGWHEVTQAHHAANPQDAAQLREIASLKNLRDNQGLETAMHYALSKPVGLV
jgi:hypothetical protein